MTMHRRYLIASPLLIAALVVPPFASAGEAVERGSGLRSFTVPGSPAVVTLWDEVNHLGEATPYAAISLDGRKIDIERPVQHTLTLRYAPFDPLVAEPAVPDVLRAPDASRVFIVQYHTPPIHAFRDALEGVGVTFHKFLAPQAWTVEMDPSLVGQVEEMPFVRWVGQWHPAYKVDPGLIPDLVPGGYEGQEAHVGGPAAIDCPVHGHVILGADQRVGEVGRLVPGVFEQFSILVWERGPRMQNRVAQRITDLGGEVLQTIHEGFRVRAMMTPEMLLQVLRMDEIWFIDVEGPPETDMDIARQIGGGDFIENTLGFTGQGVRAEVMDGGLRTTHNDFQRNPPIIHSSNSTNQGHGTPVFGIVFGTGTVNPQGRGMLPDGQGIFITYNEVLNNPSNRYRLTAEIVDPNGPYRCVFQTNSWGNPQTTQYTTISAEMDDITFINDIVVSQSQSNLNSRSSRPQAWAKNVVAVGGVRHYNTLTKSDDCWCSGASIGPASDGRVKPELTHFYDNIFTPSSSSNTSYTSTFGGTSGATPITAGHFGLMFQMWHEEVFDGFGGGSEVFDSRPGQAVARALMINSADQYPFSNPSADLSRAKQGWGMADLKRLYEMREKTFIINETEPLQHLETHEYTVTVDPGTDEFRATMVYKDLMGNPSNQSMHRINKLNLRVTAPDNTVYWGNNGMWNGNWTVPGGSANLVDTAENVYVQNPQSGQWLVEVIGTDIVEDAHIPTPQIDAVYALVVSGVTAEPGFTLSTSGECPGTVTVSWENATPNETLGLIFALDRGSYTIPGGMLCGGTRLGLGSRQIQLVTTFNSGANGSGSHVGSAGSGACGGFVQLIEAGGCSTSNVASLP